MSAPTDDAAARLAKLAEFWRGGEEWLARELSADALAGIGRDIEALLARLAECEADAARVERMAAYIGHGKRTRDGMCGRCFDHGLDTGFVCAWHEAMNILHKAACRDDAAREGATHG